jgi:hypothetical protein
MSKQAVRKITESCDHLALPGANRPKTQEQIAVRAFELWLARGFQNGSPQEDWLRAQQEVTGAGRPAA